MNRTFFLSLNILLIISCSSEKQVVSENQIIAHTKSEQEREDSCQFALLGVAMQDSNEEVRELEETKLTNQATLSSIALHDENPEVRKIAIERLN